MGEVKWIKIATNIFDDEKLLLIECLPESDAIIVIWFKLLCMAGKQNNSGVFMMNDKIAYTEEMLATIFRKPLSIVRLALTTFENFNMIKIIDNVITIPNWEKHQNVDGLEKIREQTRKRVANHREKQKLLVEKNNVTLQVTQCNAIEEEKEEEKELEIDKKKSVKEKKPYGEFNNVLLTDEEYQKLKTRFIDYETRIQKLSSYIASSGKRYKSHYATILTWANNETKKEQKAPTKTSAYDDLG